MEEFQKENMEVEECMREIEELQKAKMEEPRTAKRNDKRSDADDEEFEVDEATEIDDEPEPWIPRENTKRGTGWEPHFLSP